MHDLTIIGGVVHDGLGSPNPGRAELGEGCLDVDDRAARGDARADLLAGPPRHYGPWEQFVSLLTEGLVERGVDVTLFAAADSVTSARLVGTIPTGYSEDPDLDPKVWEGLHIATVFERAAEFDLIHNNFDFLPLTYSGLVDTPVLTTIHGFSSEKIVPRLRAIRRSRPLRRDQRRRSAPEAPLRSHDPSRHPDGDVPARRDAGDYLLFFGRIHPHKGTAEAIEVAARAGLPLTIAGIVQDQEYFERSVEPTSTGIASGSSAPSDPTSAVPCWAARVPFCT